MIWVVFLLLYIEQFCDITQFKTVQKQILQAVKHNTKATSFFLKIR